MRTCCLALAILLLATRAAAQDPETNVNSRYVVESVNFAGSGQLRLSRALRNDISKMVGQKLNQTSLDALRERLKVETGAVAVRQLVAKGEKAETVRVTFEVRYGKRQVDVVVPKLAYLSTGGWSGGAELQANLGGTNLGVGYINDGEELVERFSGVQSHYEIPEFIGSRIGFRFDAQAYRVEWNASTLNALGPSESALAYRARTNFEPTFTVRLAGPLTWISGMSFQTLEPQIPAAHIQAANAVLQTLRLRQHWRSAGTTQSLDAEYDLHAAAKSLGSDFSYNRNQITVAYRLTDGPHQFILRGGGGIISGSAPMFEQFTAGNLRVLRGWSQYELTPAGASRLGYGSAAYRYRFADLFYDAGAAWNPGQTAQVRHSVGLGVHARGLFLACAFPLRSGHITPMLIAGTNF